jgi:dTDP-4-amino-4,6-dideoxygalactose transaminase
LAASLLRREFDLAGGERGWFELFQKSESDAPLGPYAMTELSRLLLLHSFDYLAIGRQRTRNHRLLTERLRDLALLPELPDDVVPFGFPIRVKDRDRVRHALFRHHIYPPVHGNLEGVVAEKFSESHRLATSLMTLPCDQRFDSSDMERMAALVRTEIRP